MIDGALTLRPSPIRRVLATMILALVGAMFGWAAYDVVDQSGAARALIAGVGVLWIWGGVELWRGSAHALILDADGVRDSKGRDIAKFHDINRLERGVFSMKPSNGALLSLRTPGSIQWVPGLWWRFGRRVGIGGLTPKAETKAFVDALEGRLAARDGD